MRLTKTQVIEAFSANSGPMKLERMVERNPIRIGFRVETCCKLFGITTQRLQDSLDRCINSFRVPPFSDTETNETGLHLQVNLAHNMINANLGYLKQTWQFRPDTPIVFWRIDCPVKTLLNLKTI